jgi:hypothetical protein
LRRFFQFADTIEAQPVFSGLERRESILARNGDATFITDDNVGAEWYHRLTFPLHGGSD